MKIESSHLAMDAAHRSERHLATASVILPGGREASFGQLFNYLRQPSAASLASAPATTDSPAAAPANLVANIAGARDLVAGESDRQAKLVRLMEELLAKLEALLLKAGQGRYDEAEKLATQISATTQDTPSPPTWTRISLSQGKETESLCFSSRGCVRTADGREIDFSLALAMHRETEFMEMDWSEGSLSRLVDPLILNFPGLAADLAGTRIAFDLTGDSLLEHLPLLSGGSGYLAFDKNADGCINNGLELFGALSGNGFADLGLLDEDGNQWIDDGDSRFADLLLWRPDAEGKGELLKLKELGIGALALQSLATPFSIMDAAGTLQAMVRRSGIWLGEQGDVGSLQHLDVALETST